MAKSYANYQGDGVLASFGVPFPYIAREHVKVFVNGVEVAFTWLSHSLVLLAVPPAFGAFVLVKRVTPREEPLVDYSDGTLLTAFDLDLATAQALFIAQEAHDAIEIERYFTNGFDGSIVTEGGRRINNVGYPEEETDAATKLYVDRVAGGLELPVENAVDQAEAAAAQALLQAALASTSATNAATSATAAAGSASAAAGSASAALASQTAAGTSAAAANTAKVAAETAQSAASTSASNAASSATGAAASAASASTSATNAANSATAAGGSASAAATSASNAATSATAAGNSATAANSAKVAAESARDAASGSASAAATSASNASTSATNAANSASAASTSATTASTQATNAANSASSASTSATNAANSASTASTQAANASTSATNAANSATAAGNSASAASTSASTASTQATNAATSATAASNSAVTAQASANRLIPERPEYPANFTGSNGAGSPEAIATLASGSNVAVSGKGNVRQFTAPIYVATKGVLPIVAGRTSRYEVEMRVTVDGTGNTGWHGFQVLDASYNPITNYAFLPAQAAADGWVTRSQNLVHNTVLASNPTAAYLRPWVLGGVTSGGSSSGATWQLNFIRAYDATDLLAAAASASAAAASSASASTSAASAASSATLSASVGRGAMNLDPTFADWPSAGSNPTQWFAWNNATRARVAGNAATSPYAWQDTCAAGVEGGPYSSANQLLTDQYYVVAAEFTLDSGSDLIGAGLTVGGVYNFPFTTSPDADGNTIGAGVVGRTYFFTRMFKATANASLNLHGMTRWAGLGTGGSARTITWRQLFIRRATDAEIAAGRALSNTATLSASITTLQAVDTDINGRLNASYALTVNAGGRIAGMKLLSNGATSTIRFETDKFEVGDGTTNKVPFRVAGGRVEIDEALIRNLQVYPNDSSTIAHRVAVLPKQFSGADGATITFPGTYGSGIPYIKWAGGQPPALAAGESFEIVPVSQSATGFTVRAKKFVPGTTTVQTASAGTNVGGTPQWRAHKPTAQDADGGRYNYRISGLAALYGVELLAADYYYCEYIIAIGLYYRPAGGAFTRARTEEAIFGYYHSGPPGTIPGTLTFTNYSTPVDLPALGQDGDYEFGVSREAPYTAASITGFPSVVYNTTSASGVTSLPGSWTFDVLPPS